jgi:hypothetical protein
MADLMILSAYLCWLPPEYLVDYENVSVHERYLPRLSLTHSRYAVYPGLTPCGGQYWADFDTRFQLGSGWQGGYLLAYSLGWIALPAL